MEKALTLCGVDACAGGSAARRCLAGACRSVDVCARSHCSISALGCAPPSPPPCVRAPSLAANHHAGPWSGYFFFFFCLYLTCHSPRTSQGGRATCSIMHNSCPPSASLAAAPTSPQQKPLSCPIAAAGSPRPWGRSRCGAGGWSKPTSVGLEAEKGLTPAGEGGGVSAQTPTSVRCVHVSVCMHSPVPKCMYVYLYIYARNRAYVRAGEIAL